jgi:hypothetical protein
MLLSFAASRLHLQVASADVGGFRHFVRFRG